MNAKKTILAAFAGTALLAAAGAQARDGHWDQGYRDHGYHHGYYRPYYAPRVVVRPAYYYPTYYAPRYVDPYYVAPAPVYYQPAPALYGRIPLGHHSSIGFSLPLN